MKSAPSHLSSTVCKQCRQMIPATEALRTPWGHVWDAKHDAYHIEWRAEHETPPPPPFKRIEMAWAYIRALENDTNEARRRAVERLFDVEAELAEVRADLQDARDALEQAEADLDHVNRFGGAA